MHSQPITAWLCKVIVNMPTFTVSLSLGVCATYLPMKLSQDYQHLSQLPPLDEMGVMELTPSFETMSQATTPHYLTHMHVNICIALLTCMSIIVQMTIL